MKLKISKKIFLAFQVLVFLLIGISLMRLNVVSAQTADALSINVSPPVSYLYVKPEQVLVRRFI
jgi:hypothetical protein